MARADLLVNLVRAAVSGDRANVRRSVEAIASEERAKRHDGLADRLLKALNASGSLTLFSQPTASQAAPVGSGRDFVIEREPVRTFESLMLDEHVEETLAEIVEENHRAELLRSYGLQPRHRILLSGPPGNGKTSIAEALAEALARPLFTVRYDALIGSYLGETNQRLRQLFDYVKTTSCVLLFDEFDAIGKERGDKQETGEIKRVVSSLLLEIDQLPSYVLTVAATNHHELLDRAVWRRFQSLLEIRAPDSAQLHEFFVRSLDLPRSDWIPVLRDIDRMGLTNYSEAADFLVDVRRRIVLSGSTIPVSDAVRNRANQWSRRMRGAGNGSRSDQTRSEAKRPASHRAS